MFHAYSLLAQRTLSINSANTHDGFPIEREMGATLTIPDVVDSPLSDGIRLPFHKEGTSVLKKTCSKAQDYDRSESK